MPLQNISPTTTSAWRELLVHAKTMATNEIKTMFELDPSRAQNFSVSLGDDFWLDYSKQRVDGHTMRSLTRLAYECGLEPAVAAMFNGEIINGTEQRAVLHTALRLPAGASLLVDGEDVAGEVQGVLEQMRLFCEMVRGGQWQGFTGKPITDIVNIGIGGSYLGPELVCEALKPYATLNAHFVANVDGADLACVLQKVRPETTLFLIASKTFTTQETMANALSAKAWFLANGGSEADVARHFAAMSTNRARVVEFGIDPANMFPFWDWVGGRFSLWSSIGLSIGLSVGFDNFSALLAGGYTMDDHFRTTPFERNIPVILALLSVWNANFLGAETECILPYDQSLQRLPAFLQQLLMESNGKAVTRDGEPVTWQTGQIVWGEPGTNGQHAFYQLLHQGTRFIPADFILSANSHYEMGAHHLMLAANCLAQSEALMRGQDAGETLAQMTRENLPPAVCEQLLPHRTFKGNRPSNTLLLNKLTPRTLGMLLAMYEHKTFVQGVIWNIFSFDQWGVELGKKLATTILGQLQDGNPAAGVAHDGSTAQLMAKFLSLRQDT